MNEAYSGRTLASLWVVLSARVALVAGGEGGGGPISHGGSWSAQALPDLVMAPLQQDAAPPGSSLQPLPPHVPHDMTQQVLSCRSPLEQLGSDAKAPTRDKSKCKCLMWEEMDWTA